MSGSHQHPYHLVEPSPWPAVGSAAAFITAIGGVMFMHERAYGPHILAIGLGWFCSLCLCGGVICARGGISGASYPDCTGWYALMA